MMIQQVFFSDSPFSVISPSGTLFGYIPWMFLWNTNVLATGGLIAWIKLSVLIGVLIPSVYIPRFFFAVIYAQWVLY